MSVEHQPLQEVFAVSLWVSANLMLFFSRPVQWSWNTLAFLRMCMFLVILTMVGAVIMMALASCKLVAGHKKHPSKSEILNMLAIRPNTVQIFWTFRWHIENAHVFYIFFTKSCIYILYIYLYVQMYFNVCRYTFKHTWIHICICIYFYIHLYNMHIDLKWNQIYPVLESTILTSHDLTSRKNRVFTR